MKLRVGLVGVGAIAVESHLPVFRNLKNVELAAICDQRIQAAEKAASQFGVNSIFGDLANMLSKEKLDVLDICTPPQTHASLSIQAMEAGCHVLVEKPMATSVYEADKMIEYSKKHNVKLCVVHQNLCNPVVMKAKYLVESGAMGDLLNVDVRTFERKESEMCTNRNHWCHRLEPGGIFQEILSHPIYLIQSFLKNMRLVHILSRKRGDFEWMKNDELRVLVESDNGLGSIAASCNSLIHGDALEILGSKMALRADLWGRTLITFHPRSDQSAFSVGRSNLDLSLQLFKVVGSTVSSAIKVFRGEVSAHYAFISRFIDSVLEDSEPPTTGQDGRDTVKALEEICKELK